ncbi:MAG: hypothetical protein QXI77_01125 [Nanopusillaceae archaeon]
MSKENGEDLCINLMTELLGIINNSEVSIPLSSYYSRCNCLLEMISTLINILRTDNRYKYSIILKTEILISKVCNERTTIDIDITDIIGSTIEIKDIFEIRIAVCSSREKSKENSYRFVYYPVLKVGDELKVLENKKLNIECPPCISCKSLRNDEKNFANSAVILKLIRNS